MPLTEFQIEVFRVLAKNRSAESFVAGAAVLHSGPASPRYSQDIDFFHDTEEQVGRSAEADGRLLEAAGFDVSWDRQLSPAVRKARIRKADAFVQLEWLWDSAWRFFPLEQDELMGFRLHAADVATNKVIAAAERGEVRDFIDLVYIHDDYLHLAALIWAACGKNPGYTPPLMLRQCNWRARFRPEVLEAVETVKPLTAEALKADWLRVSREAEELLPEQSEIEPGCLFLTSEIKPVVPPEFTASGVAGLHAHGPSLGGAWPRISESGQSGA